MAEEVKNTNDDLFEGMETEEKEAIPTGEAKLPSTEDLDILEDELFGDDAVDRQEAEEEKQIQLATLEILNNNNVQELTLRQIREQLAEKYHINTEKHKKLIRTIVETYLSEHQNVEEDLEANSNQPANDDDEVEATLGQRNTEVTGKKKKRPSVFSKPALLSAALSDFMGGQKFAPRGEVVKAIWDYIKLHELQNPKDRRFILFDEKLQTIFKKKSSHFMKMSGLLAKEMKSVEHVQQSSLQDDDEEEEDEEEVEKNRSSRRHSSSNGNSSSKSNSRKRTNTTTHASPAKRIKSETNNNSTSRSKRKHASEAEEDEEDNGEEEVDEEEEPDEEEEEEKEPTPKKSAARKKATTSTKRVIPEFAALLNIDPTTPRKHVVKELYQYIKTKELQNPSNRKEILLDEPLQQLLKVKKVTYFSINKHLNKVFYEE